MEREELTSQTLFYTGISDVLNTLGLKLTAEMSVSFLVFFKQVMGFACGGKVSVSILSNMQ